MEKLLQRHSVGGMYENTRINPKNAVTMDLFFEDARLVDLPLCAEVKGTVGFTLVVPRYRDGLVR